MTHYCVLIIGGYGAFGARLAHILDASPQFKILIAGRNIEKAQGLIETLQVPAAAAADKMTWQELAAKFVRRLGGQGRQPYFHVSELVAARNLVAQAGALAKERDAAKPEDQPKADTPIKPRVPVREVSRRR